MKGGVAMLCFRVSLRGKFLGLVHRRDSTALKDIVQRVGISSLDLVPVILL